MHHNKFKFEAGPDHIILHYHKGGRDALHHMRRYLVLLALVTVLLCGCATAQQLQPPDMPGNIAEVRIEHQTTIDGQPAVRLSGGRTVLLHKDEGQIDSALFGPPQPEPPDPDEEQRACSVPPFPASVNLRTNQTPIRDQGGRDTCTVFAFTAALEAAYHRQYDSLLDLSEQYLNHVQKSHWLNASAVAPYVEVQPETNGGGNLPWLTNVLERYGLPEESALPYIGSGDYQNTNQLGDQPSGLDSLNLTQRALDDFNLNSTLSTYKIPDELTTIVFPQTALEGARYRPTRVVFAGGSDLDSLTWYKSALACGREVMFQVNLTTTTYENGVWVPGTGSIWGNHAMLMVGYDNSRDAFLIKNSWGGMELNWFSYDWVRQGRITHAGVIMDVASPFGAFGVWENPQLLLGRWNLDHDGEKGVLDIYRLPRPNDSEARDLRVGTYFGADGVARRVNGVIEGNRFKFTIDWHNPNQPVDAMEGLEFTGYMFSWNHGFLAGTMQDNRNGSTYGFHAQKEAPWTGSPASGPLDLNTYVGDWTLVHDGWRGILSIRSVDATSRQMDATYHSSDGQEYAVTGRIDPDLRKFAMDIFFGSPPQRFNGHLYGKEPSLAAGTTTWAGTPFGFAMVRIGDASSDPTIPTEDPDGFPQVCRQKPYLPQCQ